MFKSMDKWLFGYLASVFRRSRRPRGTRHLIVAVCDHFEPFRGGTAAEEARRIVQEWIDAYPESVAGFHDADGCPPRHTFFYPQEEYDAEILDRLTDFCRNGFGEVEIHLHHRHDTPEGFREKLVKFRDLLHERHGLLGVVSDIRHQTSDHRLQTSDFRPDAGMRTQFNAIGTEGSEGNKGSVRIPAQESGDRGGVSSQTSLGAAASRPAKPWRSGFGAAALKSLCALLPSVHPLSSCARGKEMRSPVAPYASAQGKQIGAADSTDHRLVRHSSVSDGGSLITDHHSAAHAEGGSEVCGLKSVVSYGFIHGNWSLCNSRPDGDWCGVNEELGILAETGCYADFTFPSAPSPTQPRMVNAIYYARDTPGRPRGADQGTRVEAINTSPQRHGDTENRKREENVAGISPAGVPASEIPATLSGAISGERGDVQRSKPLCPLFSSFKKCCGNLGHGAPWPKFPQHWISRIQSSPCLCASVVRNSSDDPLMIITGPLALNWRRRKWGMVPRLEVSDICGANPPTQDRVRLWAEQGIGVRGRPEWVFVKLHTHGCVPENARVLLGEKMRQMHAVLQREFNDGVKWQLHYVTAREMYNIAKAAEAGMQGAPGQWRDWLVDRPPVCQGRGGGGKSN